MAIAAGGIAVGAKVISKRKEQLQQNLKSAPADENVESASNTKARQLHKPSGLACLRLSQVSEFNGEIFTYSGEDSMTVFFEYFREQDRYVRSISSDVKPMKTLTAEQQLQHAAATTCELPIH